MIGERAEVVDVVRRAGAPLLAGAEVFDVYRDAERIGEGNVSLAVRLSFRAPDRTLTDEEVEAARRSPRRFRAAGREGACLLAFGVRRGGYTGALTARLLFRHPTFELRR